MNNKNQNIFDNQKGQSLVEVLVSTLILAITIAATTQMFSAIFRARQVSYMHREVLETQNLILKRVKLALLDYGNDGKQGLCTDIKNSGTNNEFGNIAIGTNVYKLQQGKQSEFGLKGKWGEYFPNMLPCTYSNPDALHTLCYKMGSESKIEKNQTIQWIKDGEIHISITPKEMDNNQAKKITDLMNKKEVEISKLVFEIAVEIKIKDPVSKIEKTYKPMVGIASVLELLCTAQVDLLPNDGQLAQSSSWNHWQWNSSALFSQFPVLNMLSILMTSNSARAEGVVADPCAGKTSRTFISPSGATSKPSECDKLVFEPGLYSGEASGLSFFFKRLYVTEALVRSNPDTFKAVLVSRLYEDNNNPESKPYSTAAACIHKKFKCSWELDSSWTPEDSLFSAFVFASNSRPEDVSLSDTSVKWKVAKGKLEDKKVIADPATAISITGGKYMNIRTREEDVKNLPKRSNKQFVFSTPGGACQSICAPSGKNLDWPYDTVPDGKWQTAAKNITGAYKVYLETESGKQGFTFKEPVACMSCAMKNCASVASVNTSYTKNAKKTPEALDSRVPECEATKPTSGKWFLDSETSLGSNSYIYATKTATLTGFKLSVAATGSPSSSFYPTCFSVGKFISFGYETMNGISLDSKLPSSSFDGVSETCANLALQPNRITFFPEEMGVALPPHTVEQKNELLNEVNVDKYVSPPAGKVRKNMKNGISAWLNARTDSNGVPYVPASFGAYSYDKSKTISTTELVSTFSDNQGVDLDPYETLNDYKLKSGTLCEYSFLLSFGYIETLIKRTCTPQSLVPIARGLILVHSHEYVGAHNIPVEDAAGAARKFPALCYSKAKKWYLSGSVTYAEAMLGTACSSGGGQFIPPRTPLDWVRGLLAVNPLPWNDSVPDRITQAASQPSLKAAWIAFTYPEARPSYILKSCSAQCVATATPPPASTPKLCSNCSAAFSGIAPKVPYAKGATDD